MDILKKIAKNEQQIVDLKKQSITIEDLKNYPLFNRKAISLKESIKNSATGIIAEYKRRSPSKPTINLNTPIFEVAKGYESAGVSGLSVLTNNTFFGGSLDDLLIARNACNLPLLRKEFIITEYQIYEAKANGADAILLISALLNESKIKRLSELAKSLGLDVLIEIHSESELEQCLQKSIDLIGVNNRNLKTFEVSLETSIELVNQIPDEYVKISESGIHSTEDVLKLKNVGFQGFLIGENFMKTENPGQSANQFITSLNPSKGGNMSPLWGETVGLKWKVCGMKHQNNTQEISELNPDFMGFIFYEKSPRFLKSKIPELPKSIKKVGVFVNATIEQIKEKINQYKLDFVQLHGNETPEFCKELQNTKIIKAFGIDENFDFTILSSYNNVCDYFLFDTKTSKYGGSGKQFDWTILNQYKEEKPFLLSGGIGLESVEQIKEFSKSDVAKKCIAIDVNSRFEIEPGLKNKEKLNELITQISDID